MGFDISSARAGLAQRSQVKRDSETPRGHPHGLNMVTPAPRGWWTAACALRLAEGLLRIFDPLASLKTLLVQNSGREKSNTTKTQVCATRRADWFSGPARLTRCRFSCWVTPEWNPSMGKCPSWQDNYTALPPKRILPLESTVLERRCVVALTLGRCLPASMVTPTSRGWWWTRASAAEYPRKHCSGRRAGG